MPWWFALYVACYVRDGVGGIRDDAQKVRPRWFVPAGVASLAAALVLLVALRTPAVARRPDGWALARGARAARSGGGAPPVATSRTSRRRAG